MHLPPGAVLYDDSCQFTLAILTDNPGIYVTEGESVICYGIRCDPHTLIFNQPVKINIPHSLLVVNPEQVKPDIVCRVWDSITNLPKTLRKQSSSSPDKPPYCRMYKRHLELYIGHCAEWWVLIPLEQQVIRQQLICTPYVPDRIERGQEFAVNLQLCNDLPGNEAIVSLRDLLAKISQCISIYVPTSEDDLNFAVITITITQAGKLGISRSIAFVIRYTDGPVCQFPSKQTDITRTLEEVKNSNLQSDIDILTIAQTMDVNQFYDLGIALGFTIAELDRIEYRRFGDRQQATYEMLLAWRGRQACNQAAKNTLITIIESFNSSSNDTTFPGLS
nr:uncharacterized protein LOC129263209 [Lytechinus pictus]